MSVIEEVCTITAKGQTTVPKAIRRALGIGYGGRIAFRVEDGTVSLHAVPPADEVDPALAPFLALLARSLAVQPEALAGLTPALAARVVAATEGVAADPDAPIEGDVAL
ncbi:MAG: AbrB family transcriptional regulator [Proteobacteria bacterium]|nr:AbrB family transcriptional regulator [Pseudomonadota bacterium]